MSTGTRWPQWVYGSGEEPDYRFTFANERTFLAWIRTALALLAGGVALDAIPLPITKWLQEGLAVLLVVLALVCALTSWIRWARAEQAMRRSAPLPASRLSALLTGSVVLAALVILLVRL